jgi:hypothetical protein
MSETREVTRDADWIEREYGQEKWPAVERLIEAEIAAESPDPALARVLGRVIRRERYSADPRDSMETVISGDSVQMPQSAAFGAQHGLIVDAVANACTPETDLIVELGAGWARYLLSVWASGGPADATYVAAEYTEAGRRASERLAAIAPELRFTSIPFDYTDPRLEELPAAEEAVIFSVSSVEQVPHLPESLFPALAGLARKVTAIHLEPVGWQLDPSPRAASSRDYAEHHDYSRDLVERLHAAEAAGVIELDLTLVDAIGTNPQNAVSLVSWTSRRSPGEAR